MHHPFAITNDIRMGISDCQIVHQLFGGFKHNGLDHTGGAIRLLDLVASLQFTCGCPAAFCLANGQPRCGFQFIEGMFWRRRNSLDIDR